MKKLLSLILIFFLIVQTPITANAFIFGGLSVKDEKEMGYKFNLMIKSNMAIIEDPEISQYAKYILNRLTKPLKGQIFTFNANVILHNALNAFAIPGGYVYIFTGLMMNVNGEDELAGVLAHELAHVTQRHVASRLERAQFVTVGALLLAIAGIAIGGASGGNIALGATAAGQAAMLNYSRLDETEADQIGLQYLIAAGYPAKGMVGGFKILRQKSWMSGMNIPTYLSTHPAIGDRINGLTARIQTMPLEIQNRNFDNTRFLRVKTLLWARYGDEQAALQLFKKDDGLSYMGQAMVYARQNNVTKAAQSFDLAISKSPNDPLILREAGIFHYRKGNTKKAEQLLSSSIRKDPRDYMAIFFYARLMDETGREKEAPKYYIEVLRHIPEDPEVHESYAKSLGKAGNTLDAYIHMTYSALYANNKRQTEKYFKKAQSLSEKSSNKHNFQKLEKAYNERKEIWEKS